MVDKLQIRVKLICARIRYKNYYLEITVKCTFLLDLYLIANFLSDALDKWFLQTTAFNMMTRPFLFHQAMSMKFDLTNFEESEILSQLTSYKT